MSSGPVSDHQILEALRQAPTERWPEVLAFVQHLGPQRPQKAGPKNPTAAELLQLPLAEREAILAEQAGRAEADYVGDLNLTGFDAYSEEDLHVDSADTQTR
jgi:hypothetical protein